MCPRSLFCCVDEGEASCLATSRQFTPSHTLTIEALRAWKARLLSLSDAPQVLISPDEQASVRNCNAPDHLFAQRVRRQHFEFRGSFPHECVPCLIHRIQLVATAHDGRPVLAGGARPL